MVHSIVTLLDTSSMELETYYCDLDLANMFFSILIAKGSQNQFAFTWKGRQWIFQVLPQGYIHSPIYCHNLVACDLVGWNKLDNIKLYHYIDDLMLTSASLETLGKVVGSLSNYLMRAGLSIHKRFKGSDYQWNFWESSGQRRQKFTQCHYE